MSKSKEPPDTRTQILLKLGRYLQAIAKSNGYLTDAGNRVGYWKELTPKDGLLGAIAFRDVGEYFEPEGRRYKSEMQVEIEAVRRAERPMRDLSDLSEDLTSAFTYRFTGQWPEGIISVVPRSIDKAIMSNGEGTHVTRVVLYLTISYWLDIDPTREPAAEVEKNSKQNTKGKATRES